MLTGTEKGLFKRGFFVLTKLVSVFHKFRFIELRHSIVKELQTFSMMKIYLKVYIPFLPELFLDLALNNILN
jgi:hypothetical protein